VEKVKAEKIIIDNELKPAQAYNLAKITGVEVIDRYRLILEIFARRATSKEAKLQITLAELQYQLPRARESVRLARTGEQPGFMGLGQYEIDIYYEHVKRQMAQIRRELQNIREKRGLHRKRRLELGFSLVSLAGYTNAGKSTLFKNDIGVIGVPIITVLNKIDLITDKSLNARIKQLEGLAPNPVPVSAIKSINLNELVNSITTFLEEYVTITFIIPQNSESMSLISELYNQADVVCVNYCNDEINVTISALPSFIGKIQGRIAEIGGNQVKIIEGI